MQKAEKLNESIEVMFERLQNFVQSKTVVGETIEVGDATLVPFVSVSFGLGAGGGDGNDGKGNTGVGGGSGIGAKVAPLAVLVIRGDKAEMLPISKQANLGKLLEMVPELISKLKPEFSGVKKSEDQ